MVDKQFAKLEQRYFSYKIKHGEEKFNEFLSFLKNKAKEEVNNEDVVSDLFNQILKDSTEGRIEDHNWIVKQMLKSRFIVFCTEITKPFITSDNPGYMMHDNGRVENMLLTNAKAFAFPISPTRLFVISPEFQENFEPLIKKINYYSASDEFIKLTNKATLINSIERIFSNDKDLLNNLKEDYHTPLIKELEKLEKENEI
ncbi:MAG: DUF4238 domain-containing protein [Saprospiraceae bacterium]|nr:DUF4238 domain-containing protein [Saprospiraceae bacterium]